jgi:hypothetical protein
MASLDDKIAALEAEIEGYKLRLKDATSAEDIRTWAGLIQSCNDRLTVLEKRKDAQSAAVNDVDLVAFSGIQFKEITPQAINGETLASQCF